MHFLKEQMINFWTQYQESFQVRWIGLKAVYLAQGVTMPQLFVEKKALI